eukprot:1223500-Rhodomonas_salina.3
MTATPLFVTTAVTVKSWELLCDAYMTFHRTDAPVGGRCRRPCAWACREQGGRRWVVVDDDDVDTSPRRCGYARNAWLVFHAESSVLEADGCADSTAADRSSAGMCADR